MSIFGIAWRSIRQRPLTSGLTALSLALGVALVVATLVSAGIVKRTFASGAGLGYNMIVGAKGSPLQLVLNSVYYVSKPIENIPWSFYQEFLPAAERPDGVAGRFAGSVAAAVPICMGDYFQGYRVVGTNAAFFSRLTPGYGRTFRFSAGANFRDDDFFAGVIGASVAESLGLRVGDTFAPAHGADDGKKHDPFRVVGIVDRTGTPVDRGVFVNMEGFFLQEGHAKPATDEGPAAASPAAAPATGGNGDAPAPLPFAQREVTALPVASAAPPGLPAEVMAMGLTQTINEGRDGQAAAPVLVISELFELFVRPLELVLLLVTALVVLVSAIGILVSMVGSALERSRDVAVMRALGARRTHVLAAVLVEALLLAVGGGLAGWLLGHLIVGGIGPWITKYSGVAVSLFSAAPLQELLLVPFMIGVAVVAGLLPALAAYRTDVAKWL